MNRTIRCDLYSTDERGRRHDIIRPVVCRLEDKQSEDHAARFALNLALEQIPSEMVESHARD